MSNAGLILVLVCTVCALQSLMDRLWTEKVRNLRDDIASLREFIKENRT